MTLSSKLPSAERAWLCATAVGLPRRTQPTSELDALLGRPTGWLERRAGIALRCVWGDEDALAVTTETGLRCLRQAPLSVEEVGALLVTSEAPPVMTGLAAALHHRLGLRTAVAALEIGGACTGFLAALWTAQRLLPTAGAVLILTVEASTTWLPVRPGLAGEAAALFGDGAAACLLCDRPLGGNARAITEIELGTDGSDAHLLQVYAANKAAEIAMKGPALAGRAVRVMAEAVSSLVARYGLSAPDLVGLAVHGGNGRLPSMLARHLGISLEKVWSETADTGNLGSASLPVAWLAHQSVSGPVVWSAVGAGLQWGAALLP
jgi:3-oxoacyl-[acyl-carrier-protein] synthase-3